VECQQTSGPQSFWASTMTSRSQSRPPGGVSEVLASTKISQVYRALVGKEPRRTGSDTWRAPATWRGGDGFNLSLNDARGLWHDFTTGEGGGVLDLVVRIRGGSRQDALRWVADFVGCPLDNRPLAACDRARWVKQQRQIALELPKARLWLRSALAVGEDILDRLKTALADTTLPPPPVGEIAWWTARLRTWRRLDDTGLVAEYLWWAQHQRRLTDGFVYAASLRETAERRALSAYLRRMEIRT
jgi:hypothetical protein